MKKFDDFYNIVLSRQIELSKKVSEAASEVLKQNEAEKLPLETKLLIQTIMTATSKASIELVMEVLRDYHQWISEEQ